MKIYQKVFFSIINDLEFLRGLDLNNFKNSGELLNWLISNFVNTLHDNKIYISEVTSTPINIQNENIMKHLQSCIHMYNLHSKHILNYTIVVIDKS